MLMKSCHTGRQGWKNHAGRLVSSVRRITFTHISLQASSLVDGLVLFRFSEFNVSLFGARDRLVLWESAHFGFCSVLYEMGFGIERLKNLLIKLSKNLINFTGNYALLKKINITF